MLAPIRLVRQTADQIGESDLTRRLAVRGNDDVAALASTFNRMLDRLGSAFAAQRRFLDDAGHELRTPITVSRGRLELMDDDLAEREETRALLMEELDRMNRMVNDLIMLAKADRPFLTVGKVDLADLTATWSPSRAGSGIAAGGSARSPRCGCWGRAAPHQALMQLASNAARHTGDGDTIEVGSAVRNGTVLLWVRDGGPGWRRSTPSGSSSGSSGAPGSPGRRAARARGDGAGLKGTVPGSGWRSSRPSRGRTTGRRMWRARRTAARGSS